MYKKYPRNVSRLAKTMTISGVETVSSRHSGPQLARTPMKKSSSTFDLKYNFVLFQVRYQCITNSYGPADSIYE